MPILRKERDIFPENLFELPTDVAPWEIGHLRSRQEKAVARLLLDAKLPFYLPQPTQLERVRGIARRAKDGTFDRGMPAAHWAETFQ